MAVNLTPPASIPTMKTYSKGMTARENFLKAIEMRHPAWIPIGFELLPALWKRHGVELASLVRRHPLVFGEHEKGHMTAGKTDPPQLSQLIDNVLDYNLKYIDLWLENEIDVLWFHGDMGTQNGPLISPRIFRKYLEPAYTAMFQRCREAGVHVWYSSDGKILELIDDLVECGVSIHDPQVRANGIADIYQQIHEIVWKIGSPAGGLMFFASPSVDVPLHNIDAICKAWEEICYYNCFIPTHD